MYLVDASIPFPTMRYNPNLVTMVDALMEVWGTGPRFDAMDCKTVRYGSKLGTPNREEFMSIVHRCTAWSYIRMHMIFVEAPMMMIEVPKATWFERTGAYVIWEFCSAYMTVWILVQSQATDIFHKDKHAKRRQHYGAGKMDRPSLV